MTGLGAIFVSSPFAFIAIFTLEMFTDSIAVIFPILKKRTNFQIVTYSVWYTYSTESKSISSGKPRVHNKRNFSLANFYN